MSQLFLFFIKAKPPTAIVRYVHSPWSLKAKWKVQLVPLSYLDTRFNYMAPTVVFVEFIASQVLRRFLSNSNNLINMIHVSFQRGEP